MKLRNHFDHPTKGYKLLVSLILAFIFQWTDFIYCQETDTLYYYHPGDTAEPVIAYEYVSDHGVYFSPDTIWPGFSILKIQILVPYPELNYTNHIIIRNDSLGYPGPIIEDIEVTFNDTINPYPQWYSVDVSDYPNLKRMTGNFWITGDALWLGMVQFNDEPYLHTYTYVLWNFPCAPCWIGPVSTDFVIKTVVMREDSLFVQNNDFYQNYLNQEIKIYPNPFNSRTMIQIPFQMDFNNYLIKIFDLKGREVLQQQVHSNTLLWNGLSTYGQELASGIYLVILQENKQIISTSKVIYLK